MRPTRWASGSAGFSLVELMIVVAVIGILAGIWAANAVSATEETRAMACEKNRVLYEDAEQFFQHRNGRPSISLQELVDAKLLNKATCPRGGVLTWEVTDENLNYAHQSLVCSIHGEKCRIRAWKPLPEDPGADYAFSDGFDDPVASGWSERKGNYWEVVDGVYRAGDPSRAKSGVHESFAGDESWTDYNLSANATTLKDGTYGLFFRITDPDKPSGYFLRVAPDANKNGTVAIRKMTNGKVGKIIAIKKLDAGTIAAGKTANISVDVTGDTFTVSIGGQKVLGAQDSTYANGGVGLRSNSQTVVEFDELKVEEH